MSLGLQRAEVFVVLYQSELILVDEAAFDASLSLVCDSIRKSWRFGYGLGGEAVSSIRKHFFELLPLFDECGNLVFRVGAGFQ